MLTRGEGVLTQRSRDGLGEGALSGLLLMAIVGIAVSGQEVEAAGVIVRAAVDLNRKHQAMVLSVLLASAHKSIMGMGCVYVPKVGLEASHGNTV